MFRFVYRYQNFGLMKDCEIEAKNRWHSNRIVRSRVGRNLLSPDVFQRCFSISKYDGDRFISKTTYKEEE